MVLGPSFRSSTPGWEEKLWEGRPRGPPRTQVGSSGVGGHRPQTASLDLGPQWRGEL